MFARFSTPAPTLATPARAAAAERIARRRAASRARRWGRRCLATVAVLFGMFAFIGGVGSPAQAEVPWPFPDPFDVIDGAQDAADTTRNLPSMVMNLCKPEQVPGLKTFEGDDTEQGLNQIPNNDFSGENWDKRKTVLPKEITFSGSGLEKLEKAYPMEGDQRYVVWPTYTRYGISSLQWTHFQDGCFTEESFGASLPGKIFKGVVKWPLIWTLTVLKWALVSNPVYDFFQALVSPLIKAVGNIFKPWIALVVPFVVIWAWARSRGSTTKLLNVALTISALMGIYLWVTENDSKVVRAANNIVSDFTSQAGCELMGAGVTGVEWTRSHLSEAEPDYCSISGVDGLSEQLWRGTAYYSWMIGEVGTAQAARDREREKDGKIGWSQAILNGLYQGVKAKAVESSTDGESGDAKWQVDIDDNGNGIAAAAERWNKATYGNYGDGTKVHQWTVNNIWIYQPFLTVVKFMCADGDADTRYDVNLPLGVDKWVLPNDGVIEKDQRSTEAKHNRWLRDNCSASSAGTSAWINEFRGTGYDHRMGAAMTGGTLAITVFVSTVPLAAFVVYQKIRFYWLLILAPMFLAFAIIFRRFATVYGEQVLVCIMYQCGGILILQLFVFIEATLVTPSDRSIPEIPLAAKPLAIILVAYILWRLRGSLRDTVVAVAHGDTSMVERFSHAPDRVGEAAVRKLSGRSREGWEARRDRKEIASQTRVTQRADADGTSLGDAALRKDEGLRGRARGLAAWLKGGGGLRGLRNGRWRAEHAQAMAKVREDPEKYGVGSDGKVSSRALKAALADVRRDQHPSRKADEAYHEAMRPLFEDFLKNTGARHPDDPSGKRDSRSMAARFTAYREETGRHHRDDPSNPANVDLAFGGSRTGVVIRTDPADVRRMASPIVLGDKSLAEASENVPWVLSQYQNNTGLADPNHPTTAALRRAVSAPEGTSEQLVAMQTLQRSIAEHGLPDRVTQVGSVGQTADRFDAREVMPVVAQVERLLDPDLSEQMSRRLREDLAASIGQVVQSVPYGTAAGALGNGLMQTAGNPFMSNDAVVELGRRFQESLGQMVTSNTAAQTSVVAVDPTAIAAKAATQAAVAATGVVKKEVVEEVGRIIRQFRGEAEETPRDEASTSDGTRPEFGAVDGMFPNNGWTPPQ